MWLRILSKVRGSKSEGDVMMGLEIEGILWKWKQGAETKECR